MTITSPRPHKAKLLAGAALTVVMATQSLLAQSFTVTGNSRIDDGIVLGVAGLSNGTAASAPELNAALGRLYDSGLFSDVVITPRGNGGAQITVDENRIVNNVFFEGNDAVDDEALAEFTSIRSRGGLDQARIEADAQTIRRIYAEQSRLDVGVRPVIIPAGSGRFDVVFEIDEDTVSQIDQINFAGNESVSDYRLRREIESNEAGFLSSLFSSDNFATGRVRSDRERILDYYRNNGFYDVEITSNSTDFNQSGDAYIGYSIREGQQFRFGNLGVSSSALGVNARNYAQYIDAESGAIYEQDKIRDTIEAIEAAAAANGEPFLRAVPRVTRNAATGTIDITLELVQDERVYVERIDIRGNDSTLGRVIRRQFDFVEGDPVNARKLEEARARLARLGYFSNSSVQLRDGSTAGQRIIDVEVTEGSTGSAAFGGSYSTSDGPSIFLSLTESNFLGRGQFVKAQLDLGERSQSLNLAFTEPGLFDRDLSAGFNLYYDNTDREESVFETTEFGFTPRVSFPTGDDSRMSMSYFLRSDEIRDISSETSPLIAAEAGTQVASGLGVDYTIDRRNSPTAPTRGYILQLGVDVAGLGGDAQFVEGRAKGKIYLPVIRDDVVFSAELEGGTIQGYGDEDVRIIDRFFLGGKSLKGFATGGIGPRDVTDTVDSALGGNNYAALRTQLTFPIGLPEELGFYGGVFAEAGSVWDLDNTQGSASGNVHDEFEIRAAAGVSLFWDTPLGPLEFSYAEPFESQPFDEIEEFSIGLSTRF